MFIGTFLYVGGFPWSAIHTFVECAFLKASVFIVPLRLLDMGTSFCIGLSLFVSNKHATGKWFGMGNNP